MPLATPTGDLFAWHRALRDANTRDGTDGRRAAGPVLSRQALALAFVLGTFMDQDGTTPARYAPGLTRLSAILGYAASDNRKAVSLLLRELQTAGYLLVTRRGGHATPNLYAAAAPANLHAAAAGAAIGDGEQTGAEEQTAAEEPHPEPSDSAVAGAGAVPEEEDAASRPPGSRRTPPGAVADALSEPQKVNETAVPSPVSCGPDAAQPSQSFSTPSPAPGRGGTRPSDEARARASRVMRRVVQHLTEQEAEHLSLSVVALRGRWEMARRISALCELGAEEKVVETLARPYGAARNPGAVAASRVAELHRRYGSPEAE